VQPHLIAGKPAPTRILVVDDEESICTLLTRTITPLGYAVDVALDAHTALDIMQKTRASVALVDIRMPGADGVWLIEHLQKKYPSTAIVIVTGIRDLDPRLTLRPGIVGYLTKPFKPASVREMVEKAVAFAASLPPPKPQRELPAAEGDIADLPDLDDEH